MIFGRLQVSVYQHNIHLRVAVSIKGDRTSEALARCRSCSHRRCSDECHHPRVSTNSTAELYPSASAQRPRSALGVGIISSISVVISRGCSQPLTRLSPPTQSSPLLSVRYLPAGHGTECHRRTSLASKTSHWSQGIKACFFTAGCSKRKV